MRVLGIGQNIEFSRGLASSLRSDGFDVTSVLDGKTGLEFGMHRDYEATVIDLDIADISCTALISAWRQAGRTFPIVGTSSNTMPRFIANAYGAGIDVFVSKRLPIAEGEERVASSKDTLGPDFIEIRAVLGQIMRRAGFSKLYRYKGLTLDKDAARLTYHGEEIKMTADQLLLLEYLWANAGAAVSRKKLAELKWGYHGNEKGRQLDEWIKNIRHALPDELDGLIETIRCVGYRFKNVDE